MDESSLKLLFPTARALSRMLVLCIFALNMTIARDNFLQGIIKEKRLFEKKLKTDLTEATDLETKYKDKI